MTEETGELRKRVPALLPDDFGYENLTGECGMCGAYLIVNRATDLANSSWAIGKTVKCAKCGAELRIGGDSGSHPIDYFLLWNYLSLKAQRQYMNCVMSLAQALELALIVTAHFILIVEPLRSDPSASEVEAEELVEVFRRKTRNMTLDPLRNLLMKLGVHSVRPVSVEEAYRWTAEINNLAKDAPPAKLIESISDAARREATQRLAKVTIGALRNDVAHQQGRRPSEQEVEHHHEEVRTVVRQVMTAFGVTPGGGQLVVGPPDDGA